MTELDIGTVTPRIIATKLLEASSPGEVAGKPRERERDTEERKKEREERKRKRRRERERGSAKAEIKQNP